MKWFSGVKALSATPEDLSSIPSTYVLREQRARTSSSGSSLTFILWCAGTHTQNKCGKKFQIIKMYSRPSIKQERANYESSFQVSRTLAPHPGPFHRDEEVRTSGWDLRVDALLHKVQGFLVYFYFACKSLLPAYVYVFVCIMYVYIHVLHCMHKMPVEARRGHQSPWKWSYNFCVEVRIQTQALWQNGKGS